MGAPRTPVTLHPLSLALQSGILLTNQEHIIPFKASLNPQICFSVDKNMCYFVVGARSALLSHAWEERVNNKTVHREYIIFLPFVVRMKFTIMLGDPMPPVSGCVR